MYSNGGQLTDTVKKVQDKQQTEDEDEEAKSRAMARSPPVSSNTITRDDAVKVQYVDDDGPSTEAVKKICAMEEDQQ